MTLVHSKVAAERIDPTDPGTARASASKRTGEVGPQPSAHDVAPDLKEVRLLDPEQNLGALPPGWIELVSRLTPKALAEAGFRDGPQSGDDHPFVQYVQMNRGLLDALGLPVTAEGVRIYLVGENDALHEHTVRQSLDGALGLGAGAEIVSYRVPDYERTTKGGFTYAPEEVSRLLDARALRKRLDENGKLTLDQLYELGVHDMQENLLYRRQHLAAVRADAQTPDRNGPSLRIINMSWQLSFRREALNLVAGALIDDDKPKGDAERIRSKTMIHDHLAQILGRKPREEDLPALAELVAKGLYRTAARPKANEVTTALVSQLESELTAARREGVLVFASAGNWFTGEETAHLSLGIDAGVRGIVWVGAADVGDPLTDQDDEIWRRSADGKVTVLGPGVHVPLADLEGVVSEREGTSSACPFLAGLAALMSAANPRASADDIARLIEESTTPVGEKSTRSGAGLPDPVYAVWSAAQLQLREVKGKAKGRARPQDDRAANDALRSSILSRFAAGRRAVVTRFSGVEGLPE